MTNATSLLVLALCLSVVTPAQAQQPEAESLFREGKELLKKNKIAEACAKFDASEKIDPTIGTELNLADCREKNRQYASAWAMFLKAAATAKKANDPRRTTEAKRRAKLLEPKLKYLTIKVADDRRVTGLTITRDGVAVDPAVWNQRVPVDQGAHDIAAKAPGRENWKEQVEIEKSDEIVEVPMLAEVAGAVVEQEPKDLKEPKVASKQPPVKLAPPKKSRTMQVALFSFSAASLGVGVGFSLYARSLGKQSDDICPNENCLDEQALDFNKRARRAALIANVGYGVAGVAFIGAAIAWWRNQPSGKDRVSIVPTANGHQVSVVLGGNF